MPRNALLIIYTLFAQPDLDCINIVYDQPNNQRFSNNIEAVQYNADLAMTNTIKETSRMKLYKELGIESHVFVNGLDVLVLFIK